MVATGWALPIDYDYRLCRYSKRPTPPRPRRPRQPTKREPGPPGIIPHLRGHTHSSANPGPPGLIPHYEVAPSGARDTARSFLSKTSAWMKMPSAIAPTKTSGPRAPVASEVSPGPGQ